MSAELTIGIGHAKARPASPRGTPSPARGIQKIGTTTRGLLVSALLLGASLVVVTSTEAPASAALSPSSHGCDVLVTAPAGHDCLLPWPNNAFTERSNTATHVKLDITAAETPSNIGGVHINPRYQDEGDGFSPGSVIITYVPDLSLANSGIVDSTDIAGSLAKTSPIVIVNMKTGAHVPYFAELDAQNPDPAS